MHVAEYGGKHYVPLAYSAALYARLHLFEAQLCRLCRRDELGQENYAFFVIVAHPVQCGDKQFVYDFQRLHCVQLFAREFRRLRQTLGNIIIYILIYIRSFRRGDCRLRVSLHPFRAAFVRAGEHVERPHRRHHFGNVGVDYRKVKPRLHSQSKEGRVYRASCGQSEGDIAHPQHRMHVVFFSYPPDRFQRIQRLALFRAHGKGKAVDIDILFGNTKFLCALYYLARVFQPPFHGGGNAPLVHGKSHYCRAVFRDHGQNGIKTALFSVHRIYYRLAAHGAQRRLYRLGLAAVYLQGRFHRRLYALHHLAEHGFFVYSRHARVHVEYVRARFHLLYRARRHIAHIAFEQRFLHRLFASGIYPLAYNAHPVQIHHFARAANSRGHLDFTRLRLFPFCNLSYLGNISGGRAATAAQYIHADFQVLLIHCGKLARAYRIVHVFVGKSRVRLDEKRLCRVRSYPLHDGQNLIRSQRTVHADNVR